MDIASAAFRRWRRKSAKGKNMRILSPIALFVAVLLALSPLHAAAGLLLIYDRDPVPGLATGGTIRDLDPVTAVPSNARSTESNLVGIEYGAGGALYGLSDDNHSSNPNSLFSINSATGAATLIGATGLNTVLEGALAYDPTTGLLWGAYDLATPNLNFFTLNTATGQATVRFGLPADLSDYSAMAFDSAGNLYVLNTQSATQDVLLVVDKTTGNVLDDILLTDSGNPANLTNGGMDFDPSTGLMYVTDAGTKVLYTLDTATGALSFISTSTIGNQLTGLTVVPQNAVPEPVTLALFVLGLAGLGFMRRKPT